VEHLASCYSWGTTVRNISNSALRQGGVSLWRFIWDWRVSLSPNICVPLDRGIIVLQLWSWKFSLKEIPKKEKFAFEPPFGRLRGNVRTSSIARWKARVRLPIHHNRTFFASSYCWDVAGRNLLTWAIFEGLGYFDRPLKVEGDVAHQPLLGGRKLEGLPFHVDRQTDRQNYDYQDRASTAASRGKTHKTFSLNKRTKINLNQHSSLRTAHMCVRCVSLCTAVSYTAQHITVLVISLLSSTQ